MRNMIDLMDRAQEDMAANAAREVMEKVKEGYAVERGTFYDGGPICMMAGGKSCLAQNFNLVPKEAQA